jgi:alcohol dehydrogenase class IV
LSASFTFIIPPTIIFGWGSLDRIVQELRKLDSVNPFIATSKGMVERQGFLKLVDLLKKEEITPTVFSEIEPEPSVETAERCFNVIKENNFDSVIGLGGGSAMDVAKKAAMDSNLPKIMIPTTSGTGSEVTHESILKMKGKKKAYVDEKLTADVAIVDPNLMMVMPRRLIAGSGIDALAHAFGSYHSKRGNELTRTIAYRAYSIAKDSIRKAISHDANAISNMALASLMAGMAFGNSGTTLAHALAYPLSNRGIPHREAVAIMLPPALEFNGFKKESILSREIIRDIGLPMSFKGNAHAMAAEVMEDERHLSNNPREVTFEDVVRIYQTVEETQG